MSRVTLLESPVFWTQVFQEGLCSNSLGVERLESWRVCSWVNSCLMNKTVCPVEQFIVLRKVIFAQVSIKHPEKDKFFFNELPEVQNEVFNELPEVQNEVTYWFVFLGKNFLEQIVKSCWASASSIDHGALAVQVSPPTLEIRGWTQRGKTALHPHQALFPWWECSHSGKYLPCHWLSCLREIISVLTREDEDERQWCVCMCACVCVRERGGRGMETRKNL